MKKFLRILMQLGLRLPVAVAALALFAFTLAPAPVCGANLGGAITSVAYGQTQGNFLKDASSGNALVQNFDRGKLWENPGTVLATVLSGTSSATAVTLNAQVGMALPYQGVYYLSVYNPANTDAAISLTNNVSAISNPTTYYAIVKAGTWSGPLGPISLATPFAHFFGLTATTKVLITRGMLQ